MLKIVSIGQLKLSPSAEYSFFYSKKALLLLPKFNHKHGVHLRYVQYCKYSNENTEIISMSPYILKYLFKILEYIVSSLFDCNFLFTHLILHLNHYRLTYSELENWDTPHTHKWPWFSSLSVWMTYLSALWWNRYVNLYKKNFNTSIVNCLLKSTFFFRD